MSEETAPGDLDVRWIHGSASRKRQTDPEWQVHHYRDDTVILRQSKDANFEAAFVYLLFGAERAILFDTGSTSDDGLRREVDTLVAGWLADHPAASYQLVVAHTHAHGDHIAGDATFADRADTVVVGTTADDVQAFFGFTSWPQQVVDFDLGGRRLEITGIPGHEPASIATYDERSGLLLTGDSVYPGRIYVRDFPAFVDSLQRLVALAETHEVSHVLGCHIRDDDAAGPRLLPRLPLPAGRAAVADDGPPAASHARRRRVGRGPAGPAPVRRLRDLQRHGRADAGPGRGTCPDRPRPGRRTVDASRARRGG
ncbi:MAG: MBL fold metallo-hydrolase [Nocardioides sp.]